MASPRRARSELGATPPSLLPAERRYDSVVPVEIDAREVQRLLRGEHALLVEVLPEREYGEEHLPGAINIPLKTLTAEAVSALDRSSPVIVYCHDDL